MDQQTISICYKVRYIPVVTYQVIRTVYIMAALTIKFNYVQDYAVLLREDFIKYKDLLMQFRLLFLSIKDTGVVLNRDIEFVEQRKD